MIWKRDLQNAIHTSVRSTLLLFFHKEELQYLIMMTAALK